MPLLKASLETLEHSMGSDYPAAGEARFYIALAHAANPLLEAENHEIYKQLEQVPPPLQSAIAAVGLGITMLPSCDENATENPCG